MSFSISVIDVRVRVFKYNDWFAVECYAYNRAIRYCATVTGYAKVNTFEIVHYSSSKFRRITLNTCHHVNL